MGRRLHLFQQLDGAFLLLHPRDLAEFLACQIAVRLNFPLHGVEALYQFSLLAK